jgi:hypothetical protein
MEATRTRMPCRIATCLAMSIKTTDLPMPGRAPMTTRSPGSIDTHDWTSIQGSGRALLTGFSYSLIAVASTRPRGHSRSSVLLPKAVRRPWSWVAAASRACLAPSSSVRPE